ncbi:MAG: DNA polymerase III subunit beta [Acidobacteria bacterium]|nr:DNA polymerase III subunit beta [Acidobacteriota bacterium]MCB9396278.1 DNA polymerase III subunit beta [Acidobacteriota bacterium]
MEFHVIRNQVLSEMQLLTGVIEKKNTMPILANVLIKAENNQLTLKATDLEVGIISECAAQVIEPGEFTVNAKRLFDMLSTLTENQVSFSMNDGSMLDIVCGSSSFSIDIMPAKDYPAIPEYDFVGSVPMNNNFFQDCLNRVIFSISSDPHKYALNGAYLDIVNNQMSLVSTDGHRLSVVRCELSQDVDDFSAIIPRKTMNEVKKLLVAETEAENFLIGTHETRIFFQVGKRVLFSRLIDGKYPDFEKAIPTNNDKEFVFERAALLDIMRRKMVLSSEKSKLVRMSFSPGQLVVVLKNPERGESVDTMEIEYQGEPIDIGFNILYIHDFLRNMSCEKIRVFLKDGGNQGLFRLVEDEPLDYRHVIMPMRLTG